MPENAVIVIFPILDACEGLFKGERGEQEGKKNILLLCALKEIVQYSSQCIGRDLGKSFCCEG